jgi:glycosyltransferase involved in cell wall biosynthesis
MKKYTIAVNALSALQGGGQVYISNLLRYADKFPEIKVYIFASPQLAPLYDFHGVEIIPCSSSTKDVVVRTLWEKFRLPHLLRKLKADIVFCPGGTINFTPPADCLTAVTFQNMLIFDNRTRRRYSSPYVRFRLALLEKISRSTFEKANLVIFISEHGKKVVDEKVPDRKGLSIVIPHGVEERFLSCRDKNIPRLKQLPDGQYLLYVSYLDVIKAQIEVVHAYNTLCQKRYTTEKLLLVGTNHNAYSKLLKKEIEQLGLQDKVILTGPIPHSDMPSVYHHAKAHIFASRCENCPNIVLESLGSGRPLFLSGRAPMPELAGDAAVYFEPNNPDELAGLLLQNLDKQQWMKEMGEKAFERSSLYSWEKTAKETFNAFKDLIETKKP